MLVPLMVLRDAGLEVEIDSAYIKHKEEGGHMHLSRNRLLEWKAVCHMDRNYVAIPTQVIRVLKKSSCPINRPASAIQLIRCSPAHSGSPDTAHSKSIQRLVRIIKFQLTTHPKQSHPSCPDSCSAILEPSRNDDRELLIPIC